MVISVGCNHKGLSSFLGGQSVHRLNIFDIVIFFVETANVAVGCWLFSQRSFNICQLCLSRFPSLGLHKGIVNFSYLLILLIYNKHKYNEI